MIYDTAWARTIIKARVRSRHIELELVLEIEPKLEIKPELELELELELKLNWSMHVLLITLIPPQNG